MSARLRPLSPARAATLAAVVGVVGMLGTAACVFGFRGEAEFADEAPLAGLETVQLVLPPTELVLSGDASRSFVDWQGTWLSLGGSSNEALANASEAELRWETWEEVGRLSAVLPLEIRDLTSLDQLEVQSASYLAHEVVGAGDVFVSGIDAYVSVELDGGDVEILGGTEQLRVWTAQGDVELTTSASVDVYSGAGRVQVQAEVGRDIEIDTTGRVRVEFAEVTNLDIDIEGAGQILIELDTADHIGAGRYRRAIGPATHTLHIRPNGGRVELAMLADSNDDANPLPPSPLP